MSGTTIIIDNYDSFTHLIADHLRALGTRVDIFKNDELTAREVLERQPARLLLSPGPGRPENSGISHNLLELAAGKIPILGVCLGHQIIAEHFGGRVIPSAQIMHGKSSRIDHDGSGLFADIPSPQTIGRYHSLSVDPNQYGSELTVTARTLTVHGKREIMGLRHPHLSIESVQFHPESLLTEFGKVIFANFLAMKLEIAANQ